jgi:hypothetical protein
MGVVKLRRRWDPQKREMVDVPIDQGPRRPGVHIWNDLPEYESPVTGLVVRGRRARREDLKRTGSRPYEGREQEVKQAQRVQAENDRKLDHLADKMARTGWAQAPERVRRMFRGQ